MKYTVYTWPVKMLSESAIFETESIIRGCHVYIVVWNPQLTHLLAVENLDLHTNEWVGYTMFVFT